MLMNTSTDNSKLVEKLGRKAIGPSERVVASFQRAVIFLSTISEKQQIT